MQSKMCFLPRWGSEYWESYHEGKTFDLTTEQEYILHDNLSKFPIFLMTYEGGEPLIRNDLPAILEYAKKKNFYMQLVTNGVLLKKKIEKIAPYVDSLLVSFDAHKRDLYKKIRGSSAFDLVVRGIKKAVEISKANNMLVLTNTVMNKLNIKSIPKIMDFCFNKLGVHGMTFEKVFIHKRWKEQLRKGINPAMISLNKAKDLVVKAADILINFKKNGLPIMNSFYYLNFLKKRKTYRCKPYLFCLVDNQGKVPIPCEGLKEREINFLSKNPEKEWYRKENWKGINCNMCPMQCIVESSKMFPANPVMLYDWAKSVMKAKKRMDNQLEQILESEN